MTCPFSPRRALVPGLVLGLLLLTGCGGDDGPSAPASPADPVPGPSPAMDTSPPVSPTGLTTCNLPLRRVKIAWEPNVTDTDVIGYLLTRRSGGADVVLRVEPTPETHFVDDHPYDGVATYLVTAVDAAGNESPAAAITHDLRASTPQRQIH
jgi:hypothetical protein